MRFFLVHELSCSNGAGRLRARACRPMTQAQAEILADTLDAIDGVEGVRVNPRVPSVLVLYRHAQARQDVLRSLAAQDAGALNDGSVLATLTQELESSLERHASGSRLPAHEEDEMGAHGFGPLMRFLFVRFLSNPTGMNWKIFSAYNCAQKMMRYSMPGNFKSKAPAMFWSPLGRTALFL